MTFADDTAPEAEQVTQADAKTVRKHDQARGNDFSIGQHQALAFVARGDLDDFRV